MSPAPHTDRSDRLTRIVEESIRVANALEEVLQQERRALENRDAAALGSAAGEKRIRVAALEALEAKRKALHDVAPPEDSWNRFLSIVSRCSSLNMTNGAIIRLRRQQISETLRAVSGSGAETYGPSGTEPSSHPRRPLAAI
jgi:flagellar biosynthesis/type III secretory pathway chaperone